MALAKNLSIYGNGIDLKYALKEYNPTSDVEMLDATALGHGDKVFEPGFKNGTIALNGLWKYDEVNLNELGNLLRGVFDDDRDVILTASKAALAIGGAADLSTSFVTKYSPPAQVGQLVMVSADLQTRYGIESGKWLFNDTVNNATETGSSVDFGASSSNGAVIHAHAQNIDLGDLADIVIDLQHSNDNSNWVDLTVNAASFFGDYGSGDYQAAYNVIPAGTTIRRYVRTLVEAPAGSAVIQVALARR